MSTKRICVLVSVIVVTASRLFAETVISLLTVHPYSFRAIEPARVSVPIGETVTVSTLEMNTNGQWYKNNKPMPGATGPFLVVAPAGLGDGAAYYFQADDGQFTQRLYLNVGPEQRLLNLSTRGHVGTGEETLILGFVVSGISEKKILIRAVGPSLAKFGLTGFVREPVITIYDSAGRLYVNDYVYAAVVGWGKAEDIAWSTQRAGAFPLLANSKDFVDVRPFAPGAYTIHVASKDGSAGVVLAEVYEVP